MKTLLSKSRPVLSATLIIVLAIGTLLVSGCQEPVRLDFPEGPKRLVIDGGIERRSGPDSARQRLTLSTTDDFYNQGLTPRVTNAQVRVSDDQGNETIMTHVGNGVYEALNYPARLGRTYTVRIEWEGNVYSGSGLLMPVAPIDSIYVEFKGETTFDDAGYFLRLNFQDIPGIPNYYHWKTWVNDTLRLEANQGTRFDLLANDDFFDGRPVRARQPNDYALQAGDTATVEQHGLNRETWEYYFALYSLVAGGALTDPPPAPIRGNMRNETTPDLYPLGYFVVSDVSVRGVRAPAR